MAHRTYLVMTAADAFEHNKQCPHGIVSLNQMLETRAREQADVICTGFNTKSGDIFGCDTLTFSQLYSFVKKTAHRLHHAASSSLPVRRKGSLERMPVALLAPSCKEFLTNVFAMFRLGLSVLLIAPQNTPEDIAHLCKTVGASQLIVHHTMKKAVAKAQELSEDKLELLDMVDPDKLSDVSESEAEACRSALTAGEESETECIIFHSSGSSGKPKPIPQKHKVWTKSACCNPHAPSFTTTPLFHGGISDLLRAMMSKSTLYMYPSTLPITGDNLLRAFKAVPTEITSFLSVPYILEMLGESKEGLAKLASFELVSTGGSPLPTSTGDMFCKNGIRLVSRYGSSECGFLMTSFRDCDNDRDWSYLRTSTASRKWLTFEDQGDGTYELIVPEAWPTRSKSNRPDGSFATSDLFRKHPSISDAWSLCGRADDVLLLVNGEKSSPAPLETVFKASSEVKDALVFGSNRSTLGVAIIPQNEKVDRETLLSLLKRANDIAPAHSQIPPELLISLPVDASFPRASKGSLQRGRAYQAFAEEIDDAYRKFESAPSVASGERLVLHGEELVFYVLKVVRETLRLSEDEKLDQDADLFTEGLNSVQSVRIRNLLQSNLELGESRLSANVVFECGNVTNLAKRIEEIRSGMSDHADRDLDLMKELATRQSLVEWSATVAHANGHTNGSSSAQYDCILTGATGSLGAQLVPVLLSRPNVRNIVCLCRADSDAHAKKRVLEALGRQLVGTDAEQVLRLHCYASRLDREHLGLEDRAYQALSEKPSITIHAAWPVHFGAGLAAFEPHLTGLHNLIGLSAANPRSNFYFCSSTASVLGASSSDVSERLSRNPEDAVAMGYARSKHVAETICNAAYERNMTGRIGVLRLGQLCGDTRNGVWKPEEGWPLLIASIDCVGCLPDLDETLSWLPTDKAAEAIADITLSKTIVEAEKEVPVYHVVSGDNSVTFKEVLRSLKEEGFGFDIVAPTEWVRRLEQAQKDGSDHDCLKMLDVWQKGYGQEKSTADPVFEMGRANRSTEALKTPITHGLISRMIAYWRSIGFISK